MNTAQLVNEIDREIARLQEARNLLAGTTALGVNGRRKWTMSAEARARIAAAQKRRWARFKKAA